MDDRPSDKPTKVYQNSDVIFQENSTGNEMYIIRSGRVKLVLGAAGQRAEVGILEAGEYFGEMALVDASPRAATAIAEEDNTELEVLDQQGFRDMIREHPEFALDIMRGLCERVRQGNTLYLEVIKEAMAPYCRQNCLKKTLDAFVRQSMSRLAQEPGQEVAEMDKWKCTACDYIYIPEYGDPQGGVAPGTPFEELPDTWKCPSCGVPKSMFQKIGS
jgi:rubredoxin